MKQIKKAFIIFKLLIFPFSAFTQETEIDYNSYYKFPVSVGVEYQTLSPFADYGSWFNIFEVSGNVRVPLPFFSMLQPMLQGGMIQFDSQDQEDAERWDHTHWFGQLGAVYSHRFAKSFEIGGELLGGFSVSLFDHLVPDLGTVSAYNIIGQAGAHIGLNPSYNFMVDIHPNLKYLYTINELEDFNSYILGLGISVHYRFGDDPDAPQAIIRSLKFAEAKFPPVFAAMQSYYAKNPVTRINITNIEGHAVTDIEVSFFQAGYMDSPTPSAQIAELGPGQSREVDLLASFNQEVFTTEGITPLTGEVIVTYKSGGRAAEQRQTVSYDLHDKTAIIWDDDRKAAAFITPADSALRNYASFIRQACKDNIVPLYSESLQFGMQVFHALGEIGCLYQVDPTLPFTSVKGDTMVVDSISLPRNTLKRITGDCDDLTVLYCSILESTGIDTALVTVPGHIYAAFNTGIPSGSYKKVHPEREMSISVDGELWIPVEITLIGKTDFLTAWRKGIEEYNAVADPKDRGFYMTKKAQQVFRPVGLKESDLGLQYGDKRNIVNAFQKDMDKLVDGIVQGYVAKAQRSNRKEDYNMLGITYTRFKSYSRAKEAFNKALQLDSEYINPRINLANILYLNEDYQNALENFLAVNQTMKAKKMENSSIHQRLLMNLARTCYELADYAQAKNYYNMAAGIDAQEVAQFTYLGGTGGAEGRAAQADADKNQIFFAGEE